MTFEPKLVRVGDRLPDAVRPCVDRTMLALFAGASGDHHPIHIDLDYARAAGMLDVFAHGMLVMAWLGTMVTDWAPQVRLRSFRARFEAITHLGDVIRCSGAVSELFRQNDELVARVELFAADQFDQRKISGEAIVSLASDEEATI